MGGERLQHGDARQSDDLYVGWESAGLQRFKSYELFVSGTFHLMFSDRG